MRPWTAAEDRQLRQLYAEFGNKALAASFERSERAIAMRARTLGISKPPETNRGRFRPGHETWNKGRYVRCSPATEFKPGDKPMNWLPVGTEVVDRDGYRKRKVSDDRTRPSRFNWKFVHVLIWEQAHGPVPPGHAVVFIDGNHYNLALANLELITRAELCLRNSIHNYPPEVVQVVQLTGALRRKIRRKLKEQGA